MRGGITLTPVQPNYDWYKSISADKAVPPRCPLANVHKCPRFYQNLSLLGDAGITTSIKEEIDNALLEHWKTSEYWPAINEHETSITGYGENHTGFHNFCPEVSFDIFHLFASYLHRYSDDIDIDCAHSRLSKDPTCVPNDWRWNWQSMEPLHYTDCPMYAQLTVHKGAVTPLGKNKEIFQIKPSIYGVSVDIKALWKWLIEKIFRTRK